MEDRDISYPCTVVDKTVVTPEEASLVEEVVNPFVNGNAYLVGLAHIDHYQCGMFSFYPDDLYVIDDIIIDLAREPPWIASDCEISKIITLSPYGCAINNSCGALEEEIQRDLLSFVECIKNGALNYKTRTFESVQKTCIASSVTTQQDGDYLNILAETSVGDNDKCTLSVTSECLKSTTSMMVNPTTQVRAKIVDDNHKKCKVLMSLCDGTSCTGSTMILGVKDVCEQPSCSYYLCSETLKFLFCSSAMFKSFIYILALLILILLIKHILYPIILFFLGSFAYIKFMRTKIPDPESPELPKTDPKTSKKNYRKAVERASALSLLTLISGGRAFEAPPPWCVFPEPTQNFIPPQVTELYQCHITEVGEVCNVRSVITQVIDRDPFDCETFKLTDTGGIAYHLQLCYMGPQFESDFEYKFTTFDPEWKFEVYGDCKNSIHCAAKNFDSDPGFTLAFSEKISKRVNKCLPTDTASICTRGIVRPKEYFNVLKVSTANGITKHRFGYRIFDSHEVIEQKCFFDGLATSESDYIELFQLSSILGSSAPRIESSSYFIQNPFNKTDISVISYSEEIPDGGWGVFRVDGLGGYNPTYSYVGKEPFTVIRAGSTSDRKWFSDYAYNSAQHPLAMSVSQHFQPQGQVLVSETGISFQSLLPIRATVHFVTQFKNVTVSKRLACPQIDKVELRTVTHHDGAHPVICINASSTCGSGVVDFTFPPLDNVYFGKLGAVSTQTCFELPIALQSEISVTITGSTSVSNVVAIESVYLSEYKFFSENNVSSLEGDSSGSKKNKKFSISGFKRVPGFPKSKVFDWVSVIFIYILVPIVATIVVLKLVVFLASSKMKSV